MRRLTLSMGWNQTRYDDGFCRDTAPQAGPASAQSTTKCLGFGFDQPRCHQRSSNQQGFAVQDISRSPPLSASPLSPCRLVVWFPRLAVEKNGQKLAYSHSTTGLQPHSLQEQGGPGFPTT